MTLEELQAAYPHGSKWRVGASRTPAFVIGWVLDNPNNDSDEYPRVEVYEQLEFSGRWYRNSWTPAEMHLPAVPCPITEPVTLRAWLRGKDPYWASWPGGNGKHLSVGSDPHEPGRVPPITLHPDGTYTWEGQQP